MFWHFITIVVFVLLGIFILITVKSRKKKTEPDYRTFFIMGITWFIIGIAADISVFFILGLVYMAMGLANKERWGKKPRKLTRKQKKSEETTMAILGFLVLLTVLAILATLLLKLYF